MEERGTWTGGVPLLHQVHPAWGPGGRSPVCMATAPRGQARQLHGFQRPEGRRQGGGAWAMEPSGSPPGTSASVTCRVSPLEEWLLLCHFCLPSLGGRALLLPNRDPYRWRFWTTCSHFSREAPVLCLPRTPERCVLCTFKGPSGETHCSVFPLASLQSQLFKPRHILKRYLCLSLRI